MSSPYFDLSGQVALVTGASRGLGQYFGRALARAGADLVITSRTLDSLQDFKEQIEDRHRGGGHPPTPATPPCVRVRTRRFESVTLTPIDQRWKPERFEVHIGKPHGQSFGLREVPRAVTAASRVAGQSRAYPEFQQSGPSAARCFPLPPQSCSESQPNPTSERH